MRIYLAVKDEIVRTTVADFLQDLGHEVHVGDLSGLDALCEGGVCRVSLALLLSELHPADSLTIARLAAFHGCCPDTYIVAITFSKEVLAAEQALAIGVHGYLHLPLRLAELELLLTRLEEQRTISDELRRQQQSSRMRGA